MTHSALILTILVVVLGVLVAAYLAGSTRDGGEQADGLGTADTEPYERTEETTDDKTEPMDRPSVGDGAVDDRYWRRQHRRGTDAD